jgi:hypothetical protein
MVWGLTRITRRFTALNAAQSAVADGLDAFADGEDDTAVSGDIAAVIKKAADSTLRAYSLKTAEKSCPAIRPPCKRLVQT